ncbi:hypothetical protein AVEN_31791-1 [Araneus ventricosus]|uniref:Uncharacterized protein n=1 Tax=Araneus ventricosus TaxID=182803 RepID=A0A4Y2W8W0_ARAVE|nr:hypothetical protein AVEN_271381-1 [Araneus ventricosus]GBO32970.1 hypothetical protein AVEN_31791-1 [Araneus ventricosus]
MEQNRGCMPGDPVSPIADDEYVLLCPVLCEFLHYHPRTRHLEAYCHYCSLLISVRSFGTHLHPFRTLKSALSGRHFHSNEEVWGAAKTCLSSLPHMLLQVY